MRELIQTFDRKFLELKRRTEALLEKTGNDMLYAVRTEDRKTIGELALRSAGAVEQMIGGVTRRLWDDPFEWTLTERMQTVELILEYLNEVEAGRSNGFLFFKTDEVLDKVLPAPIELTRLYQVVNNAYVRAETYLVEAEMLLVTERD